MNKKAFNFLFYLLIVVLFISIGFLRDYFFNQYNTYLYQLYYKDSSYVISENFYFLKHFTYLQLYYAKFLIIALFCMANIALTLIVLYREFASKQKVWIGIYFYLAILGASLILYLYGLLLNDGRKLFEISRTFLTLIQSPMILMILVPAFKINDRSFKN